MKTQLIKLQDNKFILVNDEEIKSKDIIILHDGRIEKCSNAFYDRNSIWFRGGKLETTPKNCKKIIAGIDNLPSLDFSLLSEDDCKTIGWVDIEKLAGEFNTHHKLDFGYATSVWYFGVDAFKEGFKTAQSINDKRFNLEDMNAAIAFGFGICRTENRAPFNKEIISFIQSLQQTVWSVEVEMEYFQEENSRHPDSKEGILSSYRPLIVNNSIKITKILY